MPEALVTATIVAVLLLNVPDAPVPGAVNVTLAPGTGLLPESFTVTASALAKAVLIAVDCGVAPAFAVIVLGGPTVMLKPFVRVTTSPPVVTVTLLDPTAAFEAMLTLAVAWVASVTVRLFTVMFVPKEALEVPCKKFVFWPTNATLRVVWPTWPELGVTDERAGATYVYSELAAFVPPAVVTRTLAVPAVPAGVTHVILVAVFALRLVAGLPPMVTPVALDKFVPVMVTLVPPAVLPLVGLMLATVGTVSE